MHTEVFQALGLSKNEAILYETLLKNGELSAGALAGKSKVHRRNVYDTMQRLLEKGLVFEILERREVRYQAVDPEKLRELIEEKERALQEVLPQLNHLYLSSPQEKAVYIYRGIEGWRNYMRDIIRVGEPFYCIGGKGAWLDERLENFIPQFVSSAKAKNLKYFHLFDHEVLESEHDILQNIGKQYKFFPKGYSTPASVDIFGDRVNICSTLKLGGVEEDMTVTVIVNEVVANAFRTWFQFMWDFCPEAH